jgi:hypothetical protein
MVTEVISFAQAVRRAQMCVMTSLGILGLLGWGAYSAGKSAWKHRSTISQFAVNVFNMPDKVYQALTSNQKRT